MPTAVTCALAHVILTRSHHLRTPSSRRKDLTQQAASRPWWLCAEPSLCCAFSTANTKAAPPGAPSLAPGAFQSQCHGTCRTLPRVRTVSHFTARKRAQGRTLVQVDVAGRWGTRTLRSEARSLNLALCVLAVAPLVEGPVATAGVLSGNGQSKLS